MQTVVKTQSDTNGRSRYMQAQRVPMDTNRYMECEPGAHIDKMSH